jgi:hypothetical protein
MITRQIKNALDKNEQGYCYISKIAEAVLQETDCNYKSASFLPVQDPFIFIDYLKTKGLNASCKLVSWEEYTKNKIPFFTLNIVSYLGVVDFKNCFQVQSSEESEYTAILDHLVKKKKLLHDKRLKIRNTSKNKKSNAYAADFISIPFILTVNGIDYKLKLRFLDANMIQGMVSLLGFLNNTGIDTDSKKLMDEYKDRMLEGCFYNPIDFYKYGLGDLLVYDGIISFTEMLEQLYDELHILEYFKPPRLSIGSTCNQIIEALTYKKLKITPEILKKINKVQKEKIQSNYYYFASPDYLLSYSDKKTINLRDYNTSLYNRFLVGKTDGGRCHNYMKLLEKHVINYCGLICDIDLKGAYSTGLSALSKRCGVPVRLVFNDKNRPNLGKILKLLKHEFEMGSFAMRVSSKKRPNKPDLIFKQDLIYSWINTEKNLHVEKSKEEKDDYIVKADLKYTKNIILNQQIVDGIITYSELDIILNAFDEEQRKEFLEQLEVKVLIFYPVSMEVENIDILNEKINEHEEYLKHNYKLPKSLEKYLDTEHGTQCNYFIKINIGDLIMCKIRTLRSMYKKLGADYNNLQEMYKLVGNTIYGDIVSRFFEMGNVVLGNSITSLVRCKMWCAEKCLNIFQTITDGGHFLPNKVPHKLSKVFDTKLFVDSYKNTNRELTINRKWCLKPITANKKEIIYDEKNQTWFADDKTYNKNEYCKYLVERIETHIKSQFPNVQFLNNDFTHLAEDENGYIITDEQNNPIMVKSSGVLKFEIKALINKSYYSGLSNYIYYDINGKEVIKSRGYETKKDEYGKLKKEITAIMLDENDNLIFDTEYYKYKAPIQTVYENREKNPHKVSLPPPFVSNYILKTSEYIVKLNSTFQYNKKIIPSTTLYKIVIRPLFDLSLFNFLNERQYQSILKQYLNLKHKYGISFEIYFINNDGTCDLERMYVTIEKLISKGEIDLIKALDPYGHMSRDISDNTRKYFNTVKKGKALIRILTVGIIQYFKEVTGKRYSDNIFQRDLVNYEDEQDYENIDKYTDDEDIINIVSNFKNTNEVIESLY